MHKETREDKMNNLRLAFAVATDAGLRVFLSFFSPSNSFVSLCLFFLLLGIYPHINEEKYVDSPESLAKDVSYYLNR